MFTEKDVEALERAAGIPAQTKKGDDGEPLNDKLTRLFGSFLQSWLNNSSQISPSDALKRLRKIHQRAKSLLDALPDDGFSSLREHQFRTLLTSQAAASFSENESGEKLVKRATAEVQRLMDWSNAAMRRQRASKGGDKGRKPDNAMKHLIAGLNGIWLIYWGRMPGVSSTAAGIGGPYVRFVQEFLKIGRAALSPRMYEMAPGLKATLTPSDQAIRDRIRDTNAGSNRFFARIGL